MSHFRSIRAAKVAACLLSFAAAAGLGGCSTARYVPLETAPPAPLPNAVSAAAILAPTADARTELERLPRSSAPPIALRRAFLELELGHARAAIDATSQVLYSASRPAANEEAFARYLRGLAYVKGGTPELAAYDLDRARQLALDPGLVGRIGEVAATRPAAASGSAVAALGVHSRAQWHAVAANPRRLDPMDRATRITVHHSAMYFRNDSPAAAAVQIQQIQHEHMAGRGYGDIGYHYLIDPAGRVWQGRPLRWQGAHASGANNIRNIGVCVLGNFVRGADGQQPSAAQVGALRHLIVALMQDHDIPAGEIFRHSDFKATACPGPLLEPVIDRIARELRGGVPEYRVATPAP